MSTYIVTTQRMTLVNGITAEREPVSYKDKAWTVDDIELNGIAAEYCKISAADAIRLAREFVAKFQPHLVGTGRAYEVMVADLASKDMVRDAEIRLFGKRMASKFNGVDSVTGQEFEAGTEIYYNGSKAVVVAER